MSRSAPGLGLHRSGHRPDRVRDWSRIWSCSSSTRSGSTASPSSTCCTRPRIPDDFLPVLVLTADGTDASMRQALAAGANDYATTPLDPDELRLRVRNLLSVRFCHENLKTHNAELAAEIRARQLPRPRARGRRPQQGRSDHRATPHRRSGHALPADRRHPGRRHRRLRVARPLHRQRSASTSRGVVRRGHLRRARGRSSRSVRSRLHSSRSATWAGGSSWPSTSPPSR